MNLINTLKNNKWLVIILVVSAFLRIFKLDFQSVWLDEIHSLSEANPNFSFSELYSSLLTAEPHPPLYFVLVQLFFKIFGYTSFVLRFFSFLVGLGGLITLYFLAKELYNKKAAIYSVVFLGINSYHIYYSQEGRMYALLFFTTTLSFFFLAKFLKERNLKWALWLGFSAGLMINSHFFGLLTLLSIYFILLGFFIVCNKEQMKSFFKFSFLSLFITSIMFLPSLKLLKKSSEIKEIWIPKPTSDAYTIIFKEFFGNSEILLLIITSLLFIYILSLVKQNKSSISLESIISNKNIFSFLILIPWIVIVILIALIRSHLSLPMIISRYFIGLIPPIIIMMSIGLLSFKNEIVRKGILILFIIISLSDLFFVKDYYNKVTKTQFREVSNFIIQNSKKTEPVVSSLSPYFVYFLQNDKIQHEIIGNSLEAYLLEMSQNPAKIKPFWYVDAHGRPYSVSEGMQDFLNKNFYVENNFEAHDAWVKHFILLKDAPLTLDVSKYGKLKQTNGDNFTINIEIFENVDNKVKISGWACFPEQDAIDTQISLVVIKPDNKVIRVQTEKIFRNDVTKFNGKFNMDNSGFSSQIDFSSFEKGKYIIGAFLTNKKTGKEGLIMTDKIIEN